MESVERLNEYGTVYEKPFVMRHLLNTNADKFVINIELIKTIKKISFFLSVFGSRIILCSSSSG
jgi:hypothetical protein